MLFPAGKLDSLDPIDPFAVAEMGWNPESASWIMSNHVKFSFLLLGWSWLYLGQFPKQGVSSLQHPKEPPGSAMSAAEHLHFGPDMRPNVPKLITTQFHLPKWRQKQILNVTDLPHISQLILDSGNVTTFIWLPRSPCHHTAICQNRSCHNHSLVRPRSPRFHLLKIAAKARYVLNIFKNLLNILELIFDFEAVTTLLWNLDGPKWQPCQLRCTTQQTQSELQLTLAVVLQQQCCLHVRAQKVEESLGKPASGNLAQKIFLQLFSSPEWCQTARPILIHTVHLVRRPLSASWHGCKGVADE